jgi:thioredoxin-related protein
MAQNLTINVDLQNLTNKESLYISNNIQLLKVPDNGIVDLPVENLPTFIELATISKKGKIKIHKLVWIETTRVSIKGSLLLPEDIVISPLANEQELTDKILLNLKKIDQFPELLTSKSYLVYLTSKLKFKDKDYLQRIVNSVPEETKPFWATKKIEQYLTEVNSVGFNQGTKEFKYLIAKNKENKDQEFKQNRDKLLILDFGTSGCLPCIKDIKELRELNDNYSSQIEIVSIWGDKTQEIWFNVASKQKEKINWTSLRDDSGAIFKAFDINVYPTYMVFDTSGKLIKTFKGSSGSLKKFIEKL